MIEEFTKAYFAKLPELRAKFEAKRPDDYKEIVRNVVEILHTDEYGSIDPSRIHQIDDGDYQGTLIFVIGASGYQPSDYWYVKVDYGSCSGCDTLQSIMGWSETIDESEVKGYMQLALHVIQGLKKMGDDDDSQ